VRRCSAAFGEITVKREAALSMFDKKSSPKIYSSIDSALRGFILVAPGAFTDLSICH
jgi:hypothetical protein